MTVMYNIIVTKFQDRVWQGTCIALTSYSEGKLVNQLKAAALLSPIAYLSHMTTALGVLAADTFIDQVLKISYFL